MRNWGPISPKLPRLWHGGDYNPDQWLDDPRVLEEDARLMARAGCNVMSVGIFAWAALEPEEGRYDFAWLDGVIDRLRSQGVFTVLATPSGARPAWLAQAYPEVLRVGPDRRRNLFGARHNHCLTSPIYRQKVVAINARLAERYGRHPAVLLWHVSNEYGGECHCELCQEAFRRWLRGRYSDDLDRLNHSWWTSFWSHTYTDWSQIISPSPLGDLRMHGLNLDWKRFVTHQTADFMKAEVAPLKQAAPELPVTTNLMGTYDGLDYWKLAPLLDVASWDNYPCWHGIGELKSPLDSWDPEGRDWRLAADTAFVHDLTRSLKGGRPFALMESTPSMTNWLSVAKLKRPGVHVLTSLQAVAHGADTVQFFQWRKGRGGPEKLHGAVLDHAGDAGSRVFADVADLGAILARLRAVAGTSVPAEVAIIFDWENRWAIDDAGGPLNDGRKAYERTCKDHYYPFWAMGIPVDVIDMDQDFTAYRLLVAPMLYLVKSGVGERLERFVHQGGTLVATYWSGIADEHDLCFRDGFPGPLRRLLGIRSEEIDALYPSERNAVRFTSGNSLGMRGRYDARDLCDLIHAEGAEVLACYARDFYRGRPAVTARRFGAGTAYYVASRNDDRFLADLTAGLVRRIGLRRSIHARLPLGVSAQLRCDESNAFLFLMNFSAARKRVRLRPPAWSDALADARAPRTIVLGPYGSRVLQRKP